jgi:4-amino-4-deoxy-L-arabinose transferase-like glycosyltransferase
MPLRSNANACDVDACDVDVRRDRSLGWLLLIWAIGIGLDRIWLGLDHSLPAAIPAAHLNQLDNLLATTTAWPNPIFHGLGAVGTSIVGFDVDRRLWIQAGFSGLLLLSVEGLGRQLFGPMVGRWSAGFVVILPAIVAQRLQFTDALAFVAFITLGLWRLVAWRQIGITPAWQIEPSQPKRHSSGFQAIKQLQQTLAQRWPETQPPPRSRPIEWSAWWSAVSLGGAYGLAAITHPLTGIYLALPFAAAGLVPLLQRRWGRWAQWLMAGAIAMVIMQVNHQRQLPQSFLQALRHSSWKAGAWQPAAIQLGELAHQSFYPLLIAGCFGLLLYQQRAGIAQFGRHQVIAPEALRRWRRQLQQSGLKAIGELGLWIIFPLILAMGLPEAKEFVLLPLLPLMIIGLTQGLLLLPDRWFSIRWLVIGLMIVWSVSDLFPILPLRQSQQFPQAQQNWHHAALLKTIAQSGEGIQPTIGIAANTPEWNAATLSHLSHQLNLPSTIQSMRTDEPASAAVDWYILQSGLSSDPPESRAIAQQQETIFQTDPALQLAQTWNLPDNRQIQLYRRRSPMVELAPIVGAQWSEELPIKLERVTMPAQAAPGQILPITYQWAGRPADLQVGLVEVTWRSAQSSSSPEASPLDPPATLQPWWHDHPIGLGQLQSNASQAELLQVTERLATRVPADAKGHYSLEITYLNPTTGDRYPLLPPEVSIEITPSPAPKPGDASAIDLISQGHALAQRLRQTPDLAQFQLFLGAVDRRDPQHFSLRTWQILTQDRLLQSPENPVLLADWALVQVLQGRMVGGLDALQRLSKVQPNNPNRALYQAIVAAANGQGNPAATDLKSTTMPIPEPVKTFVAAIQGNPIARWHCWRWQLAGVMADARMSSNRIN